MKSGKIGNADLAAEQVWAAVQRLSASIAFAGTTRRFHRSLIGLSLLTPIKR